MGLSQTSDNEAVVHRRTPRYNSFWRMKTDKIRLGSQPTYGLPQRAVFGRGPSGSSGRFCFPRPRMTSSIFIEREPNQTSVPLQQ